MRLTNTVRISILVVFCIFIYVYSYNNEYRKTRSEIEQTFSMRAHLTKSYIRLVRENVYSLKYSIEKQYGFAESKKVTSDKIAGIASYPELGAWGLENSSASHPADLLSGTLTGCSKSSDFDQKTKYEITAVLNLDPFFGTLSKNLEDVVWVYYTSARCFMYLAPAVPVKNFHFDEKLYKKEFWAQAKPDANPGMKQVITDVYVDGAGQGLMTTISSPVLLNGEFAGVVSLDIGIHTLLELINIGDITGETLLVDENGKIAARNGKFKLSEKYKIPDSNWQEDSKGTKWLSTEIADGEFTLLHKINSSVMIGKAFKNSSLVFLLMVFLVVLAAISLRLRDTLFFSTELRKKDYLTGLFNRRGFIETIAPLKKLAVRNSSITSLLLFDIDNFKRINDRHGHCTGDAVLQQISALIKSELREYDIVSRWGGEEFLVFLISDSKMPLLELAERLRKKIESTPFTENSLSITISGGIVMWEDEKEMSEAVTKADNLLYQAKQQGKNRILSD